MKARCIAAPSNVLCTAVQIIFTQKVVKEYKKIRTVKCKSIFYVLFITGKEW